MFVHLLFVHIVFAVQSLSTVHVAPTPAAELVMTGPTVLSVAVALGVGVAVSKSMEDNSTSKEENVVGFAESRRKDAGFVGNDCFVVGVVVVRRREVANVVAEWVDIMIRDSCVIVVYLQEQDVA